MKKLIKKQLLSNPLGQKILKKLLIKKIAFKSASREPFKHLNTFFSKKAIDKIYEEAFSKIFVLLKSFPIEGDIFEFGVFAGYSSLLLTKFIKKFSMNDSNLHLFDSFQGLPKEAELDLFSYEFKKGIWEKGSMNVPVDLDIYIKKKLSKILKKEVFVIKGFFNNTLENYFSSLSKPKAKLIYLDCDLYSSSKYVLDTLFKYKIIQDGTIIIFDDWMTSLGNPGLGQRKATYEIFDKYNNWSLEKYSNFGIGTHVFIVHDLSVGKTK